MQFNKLLPELSVTDIEKSREFYLSLGFEIKYERPEDKFIFFEFQGSQIMIQQINEVWSLGKLEYPFGRGINFCFDTTNIEKMYNKLKVKGMEMYLDLEVHEYRVDDEVSVEKEFIILDPDGYMLRFSESL